MELNPLTALGALDGRYNRTAARLRRCLVSLVSLRHLRTQIEYFKFFSSHHSLTPREITNGEYGLLNQIRKNFNMEDAGVIKKIETRGDGDIPATNHDVVAVILWLRRKLSETSMKDLAEWVHFGLTSEDCNNIAYSFMICDAIREVMRPTMTKVIDALDVFAKKYGTLSMLARTHGQPASPTTLGKEFAVWTHRLQRQLEKLEDFNLLVKLNGASGNYCAHVAAYPEVDWKGFAAEFISDLADSFPRGPFLEVNHVTTQIEPHDTYAELFAIFMRFNTILVDCTQDIWRYISDNWLVQRRLPAKMGLVGDAKVNPISFENAEGNLVRQRDDGVLLPQAACLEAAAGPFGLDRGAQLWHRLWALAESVRRNTRRSW